jgi:hypothetical protein
MLGDRSFGKNREYGGKHDAIIILVHQLKCVHLGLALPYFKFGQMIL